MTSIAIGERNFFSRNATLQMCTQFVCARVCVYTVYAYEDGNWLNYCNCLISFYQSLQVWEGVTVHILRSCALWGGKLTIAAVSWKRKWEKYEVNQRLFPWLQVSMLGFSPLQGCSRSSSRRGCLNFDRSRRRVLAWSSNFLLLFHHNDLHLFDSGVQKPFQGVYYLTVCLMDRYLVPRRAWVSNVFISCILNFVADLEDMNLLDVLRAWCIDCMQLTVLQVNTSNPDPEEIFAAVNRRHACFRCMTARMCTQHLTPLSSYRCWMQQQFHTSPL